MSDPVKIDIKTSVDKAIADLQKVRKEVDGVGSAGQKSGPNLNILSDTLAKLAVPMAGAAAGAFALKKAYDATAGMTVEYNKATLDLANSLGLTTEETSRLVQVADDAGIAQETITRALQMMAKNGIAPSIDSLARLSDQFGAYTDPAKRAAEMSQIFGRQWAELVPLLEQGGAAVRKNAAAVADNLIVTEKNAAASEQWRLNLDQLNDSVQGVTLSVGNKLIGVLNDAFIAIDKFANGTAEVTALVQENADKALVAEKSYERYKAALEGLAKAGGMAVDANGALVRDMGMGARQVVDSTYLMTEAEYNWAKIQNDVVIPSAEDMGRAFAGMIQHYDPMINGFGTLKDITIDASLAMQGYTDKLLFAKASEGLSSDQALDLAEKMGLVDSQTVLAMDATNLLRDAFDKGKITADGYYDRIDALDQALTMLDGKKVTVEVFMKMIETIFKSNNTSYTSGGVNKTNQSADDATYTARASGGPVEANKPYIVGEKQPELFVPKSNGYIFPSLNAGGTVNVYANISSVADYNALLSRLKNDLGRLM